MVVIEILSVGLSLAVIAISVWHLYLSHYKRGRSDVEVHVEQTSGSGFSAGTPDRWAGPSHLKFTNNGRKTGVLADHRIETKFLYKSPTSDGGRTKDEVPEEVKIDVNRPHGRLPQNDKIQPDDLVNYRQNLEIEGTDVLEEYDAVGVEHHFIVEDNKGSYDIFTTNRMGLNGPRGN